ncbi:hypothetical protein ACSBR2_042884 [Camellia fascicularis]
MSSAFQIMNPSSADRPPLSKRKCSSMDDAVAKCGASSGRWHCSKKRKLKVKRVVRVPAISVKLANIPPDDYSWRKYGQKPIKGSPHLRCWTVALLASNIGTNVSPFSFHYRCDNSDIDLWNGMNVCGMMRDDFVIQNFEHTCVQRRQGTQLPNQYGKEWIVMHSDVDSPTKPHSLCYDSESRFCAANKVPIPHTKQLNPKSS